MTKLISQISGVAPLEQAIDGTRKPKRVVVTRKPPPPAGSSRWRCPICGRPAKNAEDQARHVAHEASRIFKTLAKVSPEDADKLSSRPGSHRVTQDEYKLLRRLHAEGMSQEDATRVLGRSRDSVYRMACRLGLSFTRRMEVTEADYDRLRELHAQGLCRAEIARVMDRPVGTVYGMARRIGLPFDQGGLAPIDREHLRKLHAEGKNAYEIAHTIGRTDQKIREVAREMGLSFARIGPPVTQDDYEQVRQLHAQGLSRNAIARTAGRSGKTISRIAAELGLTFERGERTKAATKARKADALISTSRRGPFGAVGMSHMPTQE